MSKTQIKIAQEALEHVMGHLGPIADDMDNGLFYDDTYLHVPDGILGAVEAAIAAGPYVAPPRKIGTFREFMALFTTDEQLAIAGASVQSPQVKLWYDKAMGGASLSLEHPDMVAGVDFMVSNKLLTSARAKEILSDGFPD